ncbi:MAG: DUF1570 domain-containing protein [Planctomycetes bacterium]|nr:DUF1570 domain-containing protein [Planctomycetota bacterium]
MMVRHFFGLLALAGCVAGCQVLPLSLGGGDKPEVVAGMPSKHSHRVSQFIFFADFEIQKNLPIFRELGNLREQVYKELQLPPSSNMIQVFLFEDKERYERFMQLKYPGLPQRRAFFVAQPRRPGGSEELYVYTYWGDRIQQDLRHELTHALLHSVLKDVPLWLDEGLAEYFEMPPGWNGINYSHLEQLRQSGAKIDLDRLEQLGDVKEMNAPEYRESWAWVHLMLRGSPAGRKVLTAYVQELRTNPKPASLRPRLVAVSVSGDTLLHHLEQLSVARKTTKN